MCATAAQIAVISREAFLLASPLERMSCWTWLARGRNKTTLRSVGTRLSGPQMQQRGSSFWVILCTEPLSFVLQVCSSTFPKPLQHLIHSDSQTRFPPPDYFFFFFHFNTNSKDKRSLLKLKRLLWDLIEAQRDCATLEREVRVEEGPTTHYN